MNIEKLAGYLGGKTGRLNADLLTKDVYLQGLLIELANDGYFREHFAFKGGTCLIKAYFGYYRFSEDLDFSWIDQRQFKGKTGKQVRRLLSNEIDRTLETISAASRKLGLDFKPEKQNRRYVELGGSNRFLTVKLWHKPEGKPESFIKIQINFEEKFFHEFREKELALGFEVKDKRELEVLFPDEARILLKKPKMKVYDLKEIAAEKVRALLTRRGVKARDFIDLYILSKYGVTISSVRSEAIEKTNAMLKFVKYTKNMASREEFFGKFDIERERYLLLSELDDDFGKFYESASVELAKIARELNE